MFFTVLSGVIEWSPFVEIVVETVVAAVVVQSLQHLGPEANNIKPIPLATTVGVGVVVQIVSLVVIRRYVP